MNYLPLAIATLLVAQTAQAQLLNEGPEPNNSAATATFLPIGQQAYGILDGSNTDVDWYRITLTSPSDLKVWTAPGALYLYQAQDTVVRLYRGDGVTLVGTVDQGDPMQTGFYAAFTSGNLAAGDYYLAVAGGPLRQQGYYTIEAVAGPTGSLVPVRTYGNIVERAEQNDPRRPGGIATPTAFNTLNVGHISSGGNGTEWENNPNADYDLYQLVVSAPAYVEFELLMTNSPGENQQPLFYLLDRLFHPLATSLPVGSGGIWEQLGFDFQWADTFYVAVAGWDVANTGTYALRITGPLAPIVVPSTVTMHPGGCAGSAGVPQLGIFENGTIPFTYAERPVLGSTFTVTGTNLPVNTALFQILSLVPASTPIDLGLHGAPGCLVEVGTLSIQFATTDIVGQSYWGLPLPFQQNLIGLPLQQQILVLDPAANALGLTTSNRVSSVCGLTH